MHTRYIHSDSRKSEQVLEHYNFIIWLKLYLNGAL
jgi:hypothetical protein